MQHDFHYISKHSPEVQKAFKDLMQLLGEVRKELRRQYTFQHRIIGSYSNNMMTYDAKANTGYDFDVNIYPNDDDEDFTAKELKSLFKSAVDKYAFAHGFDFAEDSTRVLTIKVKDRKCARVIYSVDFCIVHDFVNNNGEKCQEYIRFDKKQNTYIWEKQSHGYYLLPEKIEWIKDNNFWDVEFLDLYIHKKNKNEDTNAHSRTIFANTVHEICMKNGYYEEAKGE